MTAHKPNHTKLLAVLIGCIAVMVILVAFSEPLYRRFCAATGLGGTTQRAEQASGKTTDRIVTVTFDGNVDPSLPWDFKPEQRSVDVRLGEVKTINYKARNRSDKILTGTATYNVQPDKTGLFFNKIQCFCFTKQTLKPGETVELPVQFYVDPSIADNPNDNDVTNITLSYTFFLAKS